MIILNNESSKKEMMYYEIILDTKTNKIKILKHLILIFNWDESLVF